MYTHTWNKYLPLIRLLLKKSLVSEQVATLNRIDFEKGNRIRKPACSFSVEIVNGKMKLTNQPTPAKDLLYVLQQDQVSKSMISRYHYSISLNSSFELTIKNLTPPVSQEVSEEPQPEINTAGEVS